MDPVTLESLKSIHEIATPVNTAFFSVTNVERLQLGMKRAIKDTLNVDIGLQSQPDLLAIMRVVYLGKANNPTRPAAVAAEIKKLNTLVLREAVPIVSNNVQMYLEHVKTNEVVSDPIPRGTFETMRGASITDSMAGFI
jgi:O-acetylhomoserine/O-acetylserine sulfhydrylase-like pyridoxal-dependent enzyme